MTEPNEQNSPEVTPIYPTDINPDDATNLAAKTEQANNSEGKLASFFKGVGKGLDAFVEFGQKAQLLTKAGAAGMGAAGTAVVVLNVVLDNPSTTIIVGGAAGAGGTAVYIVKETDERKRQGILDREKDKAWERRPLYPDAQPMLDKQIKDFHQQQMRLLDENSSSGIPYQAWLEDRSLDSPVKSKSLGESEPTRGLLPSNDPQPTSENQEGRKEGEAKLVLRQLQRRFGDIPENIQETIRGLSVEQLEDLGIALLDFNNQSDLTNWLSLNEDR